MTAEQLTLPISAVTRTDIGRLIKETEAVDNFLSQAQIRQPGTQVQLPKQSGALTEIVTKSGLNLLQAENRKTLHDFLQNIYKNAPVLHMSFNNDPSPLFQQKLIAWVRAQIHPMTLLHVGLNPSLGAGCSLRTNNKYFDLSLRKRFLSKKELLVEAIKGDDATNPSSSGNVTPQPVPVNSTANEADAVNIPVESS